MCSCAFVGTAFLFLRLLHRQARAKIRQVSLQLVKGWRGQPQQQQQGTQAVANGCHNNADSNMKPAGAGVDSTSGTAGGPGTFPSLMLNARDKETGKQLTDEQVCDDDGLT
jgi:hypothetical protein